MDHEDVVGAGEVHTEEKAKGDVDEGSSMLNAEDMQPTVEDVPDAAEEASTICSTSYVEDDVDDSEDNTDPDSRRQSSTSTNADGDVRRWPSVRTEALIHAAARDIVAHVATRPRDSLQSTAVPEEEENSFVADSYTESARQSLGGESEAGHSHVSENDGERQTANVDDGGDSSSHHENEDDVFSDNSPRSSMGSVSESDHQRFSPQKIRSPRVSDIPQSDQDEDFIPTVRGTPRPPFRSPSSVKALQMSSPPASVIGTPRSNRRTPRPTVSRLGSPSVSAQFSPKKTPPRFKRNTPPLVLLHVTVMPSRWPWGHVLDSANPSDLTPEGKTLWESWRQLQDRTGDTISDRGILLPHPQNDYEVLEERLLETLELPLRRRARILECGHYLGPSNETSLTDDIGSEDDEDYNGNNSPRQSVAQISHWCKTCRSDVRYESLGPGKTFRVKVYASNGLMCAGAWGACWKEMERVDVELEPVVDGKLQEELALLAAEHERALDRQAEEEEAAAAAAAAAVDEELRLRESAEQTFVSEPVETSPQPEIPVESSPLYNDDRRAQDEERLREIYGEDPPSNTESSTIPPRRQSDFVARETPPSPSVEALERREGRREERRDVNKTASLPELIFEAVKVLMQDQKNMMIGLLSLLVLLLAVRSGKSRDELALESTLTAEPVAQVSVETPAEARSDLRMDKLDDVAWGTTEVPHEPTIAATADACAACSKALEAAEMSLRSIPTSTVELLSTVTQEVYFTVTETMVETATVEALPTKAAPIEEAVLGEALLEEAVF
ncbi:hypothetical protein QQS21_003246 [Conoideocrella luteorostrata]|uniref:Pathway-specific nitrogen regulator n=1 Tax=Conoideocrella luteorostrata TaxID=1105319 RepID=A0AAJ0CTM9_9HYPO|nr:hypothetical protein QQS21_003246 [Conoideocrella luteorostrata]